MEFGVAMALEEAAFKLNADIDMMKKKIHRYPPCFQSIGECFTVPKVVAMGPCHHGKTWLKHAENAKRVAAYYCTKNSGSTVHEMIWAVISAVSEIDARRLYSEDVIKGMDDEKFQLMMFYDACFLVMYMLKLSGEKCNAMLFDFIESNANDIDHDLMLLENQIPWPVVDAIMKKCKAVSLAKFIKRWKDGRLVDRVGEVKDGRLVDRVDELRPTHDLDVNIYKPPHLLGILRFHIVGRRGRRTNVEALTKMHSLQISLGAVKLAEMGINLKANKTIKLGDMDLTKKPIFAELSMAPLSLDDFSASLLVNMAAHELCTTPDFFDKDAEYEDSAVCSYLLVLCMLAQREEDVHQLRKKGILRGAGLTDKKVLDFFNYLQNLKDGPYYGRVMVQIESYRINRPKRILVCAFLYNYLNWKTILTIASAIGVISNVIGLINNIKGAR